MLVSSAMSAGERPCKCDLAAEVLRRFGQLRLQVTGASMLPTIWPGDVVTIRSSSLNEVTRGDLVLFSRDRRFIVHRVAEVLDNGLVTRGDSVLGPDLPVTPNELLGRVVSITGAGRVRKPARLAVAGRLVALVVRRSTLISNLLLRLHAAYRERRQTLPVNVVFRSEAAWRN